MQMQPLLEQEASSEIWSSMRQGADVGSEGLGAVFLSPSAWPASKWGKAPAAKGVTGTMAPSSGRGTVFKTNRGIPPPAGCATGTQLLSFGLQLGDLLLDNWMSALLCDSHLAAEELTVLLRWRCQAFWHGLHHGHSLTLFSLPWILNRARRFFSSATYASGLSKIIHPLPGKAK